MISSSVSPCPASLTMPASLADLTQTSDLELVLEVEYERCGCRSAGGPAQLMVLDLSQGQKVKISQNHKHPQPEEEEQQARLCQTVRGGLKGPRKVSDPRPDLLAAGNTQFGTVRGFSQEQQAIIIKLER